jgi:hypothetical protein
VTETKGKGTGSGRPKGSKDKGQRKAHSPNAFVDAYHKANPDEEKETRGQKIKRKIEEWKARNGRPTDYRPEFCEMLIEHMRKGYSFDTFGAEVFCGNTTLYRWVEQYQDFRDAKEIGTKLSHEWWERQGLKGLNIGPKSFHGQVWSITMKNRFGYRDRQEVQLTGADGGPVAIQKTVKWDAEAAARLKALEAKAAKVQNVRDEDVLEIL